MRSPQDRKMGSWFFIACGSASTFSGAAGFFSGVAAISLLRSRPWTADGRFGRGGFVPLLVTEQPGLALVVVLVVHAAPANRVVAEAIGLAGDPGPPPPASRSGTAAAARAGQLAARASRTERTYRAAPAADGSRATQRRAYYRSVG